MTDLSYNTCASGELGMDCTNLGITTANQAASSTPSMADNSKNQGESIKFFFSVIMNMELLSKDT